MTTTTRSDVSVSDSRSALTGGAGVVLTYGGRASFIFAASIASTSVTAFAVRHGSGLLSVVLPFQRTLELTIPSMDTSFDSPDRLCVAVDAADGVTTGISASDRARTARVLGGSESNSSDLTRPGHVMVVAVNPSARPSTMSELALRLINLSNLGSAAVITDLVGISNPTGLMSPRESLRFAQEFGLEVVVGENIAGDALSVNAR